MIRANYDTFIEQLVHSNKAKAGDQFSTLIALSSDVKAGRKQLSVLIPIVILSLVFIFLIGFTVSVLVSRSISRPLEQLAQGAEIIGSGNFEYKTATRGKDEIGTLSRSFDKMTERLQTTTVSRDALQREVIERKRAEVALHRTHDELQRKNRDLETLLYVTSHDLREPLRSIENFSHLVRDRYADRLDDKGKDFLRRVVGGAQRMDRLIADILALTRVQRIEPPAEDVEGASLVQAALLQLEGKIKKTGAQVRIENDFPRLRVHKTLGTQAISNLIANALKFTSNGHAPDIEVAPYQPGDGELAPGIVVRDRGPGVAPEHAERIFQFFQRAVGREVEGTGAGLAIVQRVAERHGGRVWVQPREGGGSEFFITFGAAHTSERNAP